MEIHNYALLLFFPIILTVLISIVKPIFVNRYLLFVMPYLAIITAYGIVSLFRFNKWSNKNYIGSALLLLFISLSIMGVKNYFSTFQKEDYRGVAQFMSHNCLNSLRLYYPKRGDSYVTYYNGKLKSQFPSWYGLLNNKVSAENIANNLPNDYKKVCLMLGHLFPETAEERFQINLIQTALQIKYPKVSKVKFYELEVDTYSP